MKKTKSQNVKFAQKLIPAQLLHPNPGAMHPSPVHHHIKVKKQLTREEEFKVLLLVLDKFLWLGFGIMAFGLYEIFVSSTLNGLYLMGAGAVVLVAFMILLIREYEISA